MMAGSNRQLATNIAASFIAFMVSAGINFFLTPFVIKSLGAAAYGFIGLSLNIINYTSLITVALNAMAGRFISINYIQGNINIANKYFASLFYSNIILGGLITLLAIIFVIYINSILYVPDNLLKDVRLLFSLLVINSLLGLVTNIFNISSFIKNRLDLSSTISMVGSFVYASSIFMFFLLLNPHVWFYGMSSLIVTFYNALANRKLRNQLTPELRVKINNFDINKVVELIKSGAWNIINKLSNILSQGFDLLFTNLFVGATAMGLFSISKTVPMMALALVGSIAGVFGPKTTYYYASGMIDNLVNEIQKSIRVISGFSTPILCTLYIFSGDFYRLWLPNQNYKFLWLLTVLGFIASPISMPLEGLWNVFTITKKLKFSSLTVFVESVGVFSTILLSMLLIKDPNNRLLVLACTRAIWGLFRSLTFLPMYAAYCLNQKTTLFYKYLTKSVFALAIACGICYLLRSSLIIDSWNTLIIAVLTSCIIGFICHLLFVMNKHDKQLLFKQILKKS